MKTKACMIDLYKVEDRVEFPLGFKDGNFLGQAEGTILKLYKSGHTGSAKIKSDNGKKRITRRLHQIKKI